MAERKAQNKYYPPDFDPKKHRNLDHYHGTHRLRDRAKKISQGIIIIRFEMPYNIWCSGCGVHVGMGVRYDAEKKKCGYYYSTPLYQFRMKCMFCENYYVLQTDPENFDYKIIEGATRQERRFDPSENDGFAPIDRSESHRLAADAMYKLEKSNVDKETAKLAEPAIIKLEKLNRIHKDDFFANQMARSKFRKEKKDILSNEAMDKALMERASLAGSRVKLLAETEDDRNMAQLISQARTITDSELVMKRQRELIEDSSIFEHRNAPKKGKAAQPSTSAASMIKHKDGRKLSFDVKEAIKRSCERKRTSDALNQMQMIKGLVRPKRPNTDTSSCGDTSSHRSSALVSYDTSDSN